MDQNKIFDQQPKQLFKIGQLIDSGVIGLDDLADIVPGILHVNSREDLALQYMSTTGLDIIRYSMEELEEHGASILEKHQNEYTLKVTYPRLFEEINKNDAHTVVPFIQDWQHQKCEKPFFLFTTSKILNENQLISISLFPEKISIFSKNIQDIFGLNKIFDRYYMSFMNLTKREKETLIFLGKGLSRREISDAFFISEKTVKKHCENIYRKLGTSKRTDLEKIAKAFSPF